jgi:hypothetical protein
MKKFTNMINENVGSKFKIGLDVHGVTDAMPEFFSFLTNAFISAGGEVHIITGGRWDSEFDKQLQDWGIKFTHKFSVYDHLKESDAEIIGQVEFPDGTIQKNSKM